MSASFALQLRPWLRLCCRIERGDRRAVGTNGFYIRSGVLHEPKLGPLRTRGIAVPPMNPTGELSVLYEAALSQGAIGCWHGADNGASRGARGPLSDRKLE